MPAKKRIFGLRVKVGQFLENLSKKRVQKFEKKARLRESRVRRLKRIQKASGENLMPKTKVDSAFEFAELARVKAKRIKKRHETGWIGRAVRIIKGE